MKKKSFKRNLDKKAFENAKIAIQGGKESGSLDNIEFIESLVKSYKGKTAQTPIDVIATSSLFLNAKELTGVIGFLKYTLHVKMLEELKEKAEKGKATVSDTTFALALAAVIEGQTSKD